MPLSVVPHTTFHSLVAALGNPAGPRLRLLPVVIPTLAFADALKREITRRFGICMGVDWMVPQAFIHRAIGPGEDSAWLPRRLQWQLLPHMAEAARRFGLAAADLREQFALAGKFADRLDQYGHYRPELIYRWAQDLETDRVPTGPSAAGDPQSWQRELWQGAAIAIGQPHPAVELFNFFADPVRVRDLREAMPEVTVIGSGSLDPLLLEVLRRMGEANCEIRLHVLLASLEYLGELHLAGDPPGSFSDAEEFQWQPSHPLVASMGRATIGTFVLLGNLDEQYAHWPDPAAAAAPTSAAAAGSLNLLQRLQDDIRALRPPQPQAVDPADSSIRVHACYGIRRELEVLRDELLRAFAELPALRPDEVHIVCTDPELYAPLVPAVLSGIPGELPVRMAERSAGEIDPVPRALLQILEMVTQRRLVTSAVLELLRNEAVLRALGDEDGSQVRRWLLSSGMTHGVGRAHPGESTFARDRLLAGRWFGRDHADTDSWPPIAYPAAGLGDRMDGNAAGGAPKRYLLPVADSLVGDLPLRCAFHDWLADLEHCFLEWQTPVPAAAWAIRLQQAGSRLLGGDADELLGLQAQLSFLKEIGCAQAIDAGCLLDWLQGECGLDAHRSGTAGHIPFARMRQLQNLPCRVLAIVGMQHSAFPAQSRTPAWDILRQQPRIWDRNPRIDDRQLFLDALLAPSERLIITAANRNVRSNKSEPFSTCVDELVRVLRLMGAPETIVVQQRLQPFLPEYFGHGRSLPRSFCPRNAAIAEQLRLAREQPQVQPLSGRASALAEPVPLQEITLSDLAAFWRDPARGYLHACGIALPKHEPADDEFDRQPLHMDQLQQWQVKDRAVRALSKRTLPVNYLQQQAAADRMLPPLRLGDLRWQQLLGEAEPLAEALAALSGEVRTLAVQLPDGTVINGTVQLHRDGTRLLSWRTGSFTKPKHFIEPWLQALLAAACGLSGPMLLLAEDAPGQPQTTLPIAREDALPQLERLVAGYRVGQLQPLAYAAATSDLIAKGLLRSPVADQGGLLDRARTEWERDGFNGQTVGEGRNPAASLAWRDRDPFNEEPDHWLQWANDIAVPLRKWGGFK